MGCIPSMQFPLCGKTCTFPNPSLSSVPCRCTSGPWGDSIIDLLERKVMKFHEISTNMEFCNSQLIRQGNLIPFQQKCMPTRNKSRCNTLLILVLMKKDGNHEPEYSHVILRWTGHNQITVHLSAFFDCAAMTNTSLQHLSPPLFSDTSLQHLAATLLYKTF